MTDRNQPGDRRRDAADAGERAKSEIQHRVESQENRKLRGQAEKNQTIWFGLGMFGLVGWSVTIPALGGVALGLWIDHRWPSRYSWTLMLLVAGAALGCWNAWNWIHREGRIDR